MVPSKQFRYGTLLRVRQRQEELKSMALAQMRRAVRVAEQQRSEIVGQQLAALTTAAERTQEDFDAGDVRRYFLYERHLSRLAVEKDAEITDLRTREDERRLQLEDAMKDRKMLERLKARKEKAYQYAVNKEEQKLLDEAAVNRAAMGEGRARR